VDLYFGSTFLKGRFIFWLHFFKRWIYILAPPFLKGGKGGI